MSALSRTRTADGVRFVFGFDAVKQLVDTAETLTQEEYRELVRKADLALDERKSRAQQPRVKEQIVRDRSYPNQRLVLEEVGEFTHQPSKPKHVYRMVVPCKTIVEERGQRILGQRQRYFFYPMTSI